MLLGGGLGELVGHSGAGTVQSDARREWGDPQRGSRFAQSQPIDSHELQHSPLPVGQVSHRLIQATAMRFGIQALVGTANVVSVKEPTAEQPARRLPLTAHAPPVRRDSYARNPEQPRRDCPAVRSVGARRLNRSYEDVGREVGGSLAVANAACDETLHSLNVLAVERLEGIGI